MEELFKYYLSEEEKYALIEKLTPELPLLRAKAEISQEEIANIIGTSRQTYGAIERKARKMSWNTYLSLVWFYDYNRKTHKLIRNMNAFPHELIKKFNVVIEDLLDNYDLYTDEEKDQIKEIFQKVADLNTVLDKYDVDESIFE